MTMTGIRRIDAITRTVPDLESATHFYGEAMAFARVGGTRMVTAAEAALLGCDHENVERRTLQLHEQTMVLLRFDPSGQAYPADSTSTDLWFQHCAVVVSDMGRAFDRVMKAGATPISEGGPQHLPANTGGVSAFKFRDPFGHPLELLHFPEGVGDPAWHRARSTLFRGIDHTAIAVSSADASEQFYADVLGLVPAQRSHNHGPAQSRLDAVPADNVDVRSLTPPKAPPHLELLGYRTGRRRMLDGAAPSDAAVTRTVATGNIEAIADRLVTSGHPAPRRGDWEGRPAIAFTDRDGHAWLCQADA